jgi:glycosyltransferase involved in cell wall biosynthesis
MTAKPPATAPLHLLFVTADRFPPFRPAAKALFADELPRRGHTIDWLTQSEGPEIVAGIQPFQGGTAYVAPLPAANSAWRRCLAYLHAYANSLRMFQLLRRGRYSVLQVKDLYLVALLAIVAGRLANVPLFYWLAFPHAETLLFMGKHKLARYPRLNLLRGRVQKWVLYRVILPASRHVFVQSDEMRRQIMREGIPGSKLTPIPTSLNLAELASGDAAPKPEGELWIVYLGTIGRERRLEIVVQGFPQVVKRFPNARLVLVGGGDMAADEAALHAAAAATGCADRITITGWLPMRDAWSYARAADVCLSPIAPLPIFDVGSPTKLVEYMAVGKPVVANHHPEQTAVIRQSGAGVLCGWSADEFAAAITTVLSLPPEEREAMAAAGLRFVQEHRTHERMADLIERTYARVLADVPDELPLTEAK